MKKGNVMRNLKDKWFAFIYGCHDQMSNMRHITYVLQYRIRSAKTGHENPLNITANCL